MVYLIFTLFAIIFAVQWQHDLGTSENIIISTQLRALMECLEQLTPRMGPEYPVRYEHDIIYGMETIIIQMFLKENMTERPIEYIVAKLYILEINMYCGVFVSITTVCCSLRVNQDNCLRGSLYH